MCLEYPGPPFGIISRENLGKLSWRSSWLRFRGSVGRETRPPCLGAQPMSDLWTPLQFASRVTATAETFHVGCVLRGGALGCGAAQEAAQLRASDHRHASLRRSEGLQWTASAIRKMLRKVTFLSPLSIFPM